MNALISMQGAQYLGAWSKSFYSLNDFVSQGKNSQTSNGTNRILNNGEPTIVNSMTSGETAYVNYESVTCNDATRVVSK